MCTHGWCTQQIHARSMPTRTHTNTRAPAHARTHATRIHTYTHTYTHTCARSMHTHTSACVSAFSFPSLGRSGAGQQPRQHRLLPQLGPRLRRGPLPGPGRRPLLQRPPVRGAPVPGRVPRAQAWAAAAIEGWCKATPPSTMALHKHPVCQCTGLYFPALECALQVQRTRHSDNIVFLWSTVLSPFPAHAQFHRPMLYLVN